MERFTEKIKEDYICNKTFEVCEKQNENPNDEDCCCYCEINKKMRNKLGEYEDAEEQGLILRLPCKVGDTVYCVEEFEDGFEYYGYVFMAMCGEYFIVTPEYDCDDFNEQLELMEEDSAQFEHVSVNIFHKSKVAITKEEAKKKLAEMKGE